MYKNIIIQSLTDPLFTKNGILAEVLRLDLIHPDVSGNKWFKLKYHLKEAIAQKKKGMVSFGGAYSNHLVAMAYACRHHGLRSAAIIRGEESAILNPSLQQMKDLGMKLLFTGRASYRDKDKLAHAYLSMHTNDYYVPEGGRSEKGIEGAAEIMKLPESAYSHVLCALGTGTTMTGIINGGAADQETVGISSLKISEEKKDDFLEFIRKHALYKHYTVSFDYHFGGYARKNSELLAFMNDLYSKEGIPTDFVYTAKLFYAAYDLTRKRYFPSGSRVLLVHSGGLQGNRSLSPGLLQY